jgi:hypothetical protein
MNTSRSHRLKAIVAGAALAAVGLAAPAQATEYHRTVWDIGTNGGRSCSHGLNGVPQGAVGTGGNQRIIYSETSIGCNYGWSGLATSLTANLYLENDYVTEANVDGWHVGLGNNALQGTSKATGDYTHVETWSRHDNLPMRYGVTAWTTYLLPLAGTEDFTSYPRTSEYSCSAYSRLHDNGTWHYSGLSCSGEGYFTAGVAPYYD